MNIMATLLCLDLQLALHICCTVVFNFMVALLHLNKLKLIEDILIFRCAQMEVSIPYMNIA